MIEFTTETIWAWYLLSLFFFGRTLIDGTFSLINIGPFILSISYVSFGRLCLLRNWLVHFLYIIKFVGITVFVKCVKFVEIYYPFNVHGSVLIAPVSFLILVIYVIYFVFLVSLTRGLSNFIDLFKESIFYLVNFSLFY